MSAEGRLHDALARLESTGTRALQDLVRIPSPIGDEERAQLDLARRFRELGLETHVFDIEPDRLADAPLFNRHPRSYEQRPCVVAVLKGRGTGRSLILNGHMDTAPVGDPARWSHEAGAIHEGRLFGRGSWDDKAGLAQMLMIAEALRTSGVMLDGDIVFKSVVEDEESGNGTLACLERGFSGDAAIVLDGTWPEGYVVSHIGHLWFEITLEGRGAPSSVSSRGLNPLRGLGPLVQAFEVFAGMKNDVDGRAWGSQTRPHFVNLGRVQGGDYPGSVPRSCRVEGHYGFLPPVSPQEARIELEDLMEQLGRSPSWPLEAPPRLRFYGAETPAFTGRADSELIGLLRNVVMRVRGHDVQEKIITGWCDLRHYESNPWFDPIPSCLYGPGGGANAHIEDEYFRLEHLVPVAQSVVSVALGWCGSD